MVSIRFADKDMNTLFTTNTLFENNMIPKNTNKQFINISPNELNSKFGFAKKEIIDIIMNIPMEEALMNGKLSKHFTDSLLLRK